MYFCRQNQINKGNAKKIIITWAETVISSHALNARNEMKVISNEFIELAKSKGYNLNAFEKLIEKI